MRRFLAVLTLAAVVAGGCASADRVDDGAASGRAGSPESESGTTAPPGRPGSESATPTSTSSRQAPTGSQPTGTRSPAGGTSGSPGTTGQPQAQAVRVGSYGSLARTILSRSGASSIVVEILQQAPPRAGTTDYVVGVLREVARKPVDRPSPIPVESSDTVWTADEIRAAADRFGRAQQSQSTAVVRLLFLRGRFEEESALGVAVRGDVAAVFGEQVARASRPLLDPSVVEQAVTTHELGHLLGLVDIVRKTGRADPDHPEHSRNQRSVMYWAVESDLISQVITGEPPRRFDNDDLADLAALREGG